MAASIALTHARVLTDGGFVDDACVLVADGRIGAVTRPGDARLQGVPSRDLGGALLLPGFIDLQVNGGGGVLFNDTPSVEGIRAIGAAHRKFGTTGFLPTFITDEPRAIARAMDAARDALEARVPGALGIHVEGPYINAERKGTHDVARIRLMDDAAIELLSSLGRGRTLVTLAPEKAGAAAIERLAGAGVIVSAGHSNASYAQMLAAFDAGLTGVTHLYNAMSQVTSREPGVVGAALSDPRCACGIIVDGRHVHPAVLRLALRAKAHDRFILVSDAMPCVGHGSGTFLLQGKRIEVRDGVCVDEQGVLSGSALDMARAVRNAVHLLGLPLEEAARMASTYPARFLGLDGERGRIAAGLRADFVIADEELNVKETWIDGTP